MEPAITIFQSFSKPLPHVDSDNVEYRAVTSEAISNQNQDPIRVLTKKDSTILLKSAQEALQLTPSIPERLQRPMPLLHKTHYLHTECDVLHASELQLIHPVNVVLSGILAAGVTLRCQSEVVSQKGKARVDLIWRCQKGSKTVTVAVLEYKNTKALRLDDWKPIITDVAGAPAIINSGLDADASSLLKDNALKLSRQLKKYSRECKDIVLFDWYSMYIFDFEGASENRRHPFPTRITYSSDSSKFRRLLLGMIYRRLKKEGLVKA
uniref:Fungal-type protein kinase domain-containing protein n=1 Tax=Coccidioides posadasii RMSCC 3488 TaxID=454284 RepID=A0A0J6FJX5_COCPO|nr:hypothetical protein CPAG_09775 [Coccidioides posadasii RMSCC 3488]